MTKSTYHTTDFCGYSIFIDKLSSIDLNKKIAISTINQYSYCIAEEDADFKKALMNSDILLPDGISIVHSVRLLTGKHIEKITGATIHHFLLDYLNKNGLSCFYMGSSENVLLKIRKKLSREYPNIKVGTYSPPFTPVFSDDDNNTIIQKVNEFKPTVLFIGMTAPKQEKWSIANKDKLDMNVICSIGAAFDFYAGTIERPSQFWISLGLEWFIRLVKEPKRMWRRYLYYGPIFIWIILKKKFSKL